MKFTIKMLVPYIVVRILCIVCFLLNLISLCLCLSALILSLVAYFDVGQVWSDVSTQAESLLPKLDELINNRTLFNGTLFRSSSATTTTTTTTTTTIEPPIISTESNSLTFPLPDSEQEHFNMIVYLMFYMTAAILALLGATTRFRLKKIYFLILHVALLFVIITFNLLAWFQFRSYSPLNTSPFDDIQVLLASLFDFLVLLVGLSLLTSLILNRHFVENKQRNSISPLTSATGSNRSLAAAEANAANDNHNENNENGEQNPNRSNSNLSTITITGA